MKGHKVKIEWRGNGGRGLGSALAKCECGWLSPIGCSSSEIARNHHANHKFDVREARKIIKASVA